MVGVSGLRIRMLIEGTGTPVLLLNGLTRPLESWAPFMEALQGHTIVSFDAPGVGGSPLPILPLSIPRLAAIAGSVLDEAGFETADVLGFSHGGAVAQQLAVDAPARVRHLVLVSTSCGVGATPGDQSVLRSLRAPAGARSWPRTDAVGARCGIRSPSRVGRASRFSARSERRPWSSAGNVTMWCPPRTARCWPEEFSAPSS